MRWFWVLLAAALVFGACAPQRPAFRTGDLLFQDLDCGAICDAIEDVTMGVRGARLSHVALVDVDPDGAVYVVEALDGVTRLPLDTFLDRTAHRYVHARFRPALRDLAERAVAAARGLLGRPYDPDFRAGDGAYYCSELIYEAFAAAGAGASPFALAPMDYRGPEGEESRAWRYWLGYFAARGLEVPQGQLGINPGALSRSSALDIVHFDP